MRAWVLFTIVRVGMFAILFAVLYALTAQLGAFAPGLDPQAAAAGQRQQAMLECVLHQGLQD